MKKNYARTIFDALFLTHYFCPISASFSEFFLSKYRFIHSQTAASSCCQAGGWQRFIHIYLVLFVVCAFHFDAQNNIFGVPKTVRDNWVRKIWCGQLGAGQLVRDNWVRTIGCGQLGAATIGCHFFCSFSFLILSSVLKIYHIIFSR